MSGHELLFDFVTLWVTVDPFGSAAVFLAVTKEMTPEARRGTAFRATLIAFTSGTLALMLLGDRFMALIGRAGASVLSRVMGMILAAVAVQMVYSALKGQIGPG